MARTSQAIKEDANSIRRRQHDIDNIYNIQKRSQIHNKTTEFPIGSYVLAEY